MVEMTDWPLPFIRIANLESSSLEAVAVSTAGGGGKSLFLSPLLPVLPGWTGPAGGVYQAEEEGV